MWLGAPPSGQRPEGPGRLRVVGIMESLRLGPSKSGESVLAATGASSQVAIRHSTERNTSRGTSQRKSSDASFPPFDSRIIRMLIIFLIYRTHQGVRIECPFCKEKSEKPFNRHDNFKHHIGIHAQPRNHGRVEYVPEAAAYYRKLVAATKPRKPSKKTLKAKL